MTTARFHGGMPLRGRVRLPGDKSLSHRALIFASLAEGSSQVSGLSDGDDVARTKAALLACGIGFSDEAIAGGRSRFREPLRPLDIGNSGTSMRLLAGVFASFPFLTVLVGDDSIHRRPMDRVVVPLRQMGAQIDGRDDATRAPLVIRGGDLRGIDYTTPVPSAQVKSAILLAGLAAKGNTTVREAVPTRAHTEEFFDLTGISYERFEENGARVVRIGPAAPSPFKFDVPGDPSQAAFLAVAASIVEGSELVLENVYVGKERAGFLAVLQRMGASIALAPLSATTADITIRATALHGTEIGGEEISDCIDELPVLAVAGAFAEGTTRIVDAEELRLKESDRIETMTNGLRAFGARVEALPDGMVLEGGGVVPSGSVDSAGDHRVAMALAIAALAGTENVSIDGFDAVATSWPSFETDLEALLCR